MDELVRFSFDDAPIRGALIQLDQSWQQVRARNPVPTVAEQLLGCALAGAGLLISGIKLKGRLTLQLQGSGLVRLLLAQCHHDGRVRGVIRAAQAIPPEIEFANLCADAVLVINIEQEQPEHRYQGVVPLEGNSLAQALEHYFTQSEQLETRVWLACDSQRSAGLLLQKLPQAQGDDGDSFNHLSHLAASVRAAELLHTPANTLLYRLFHAEQIRLAATLAVRFGCHCSRQRVVQMLQGLGRSEMMETLGQEQQVTVDCEFCNQRYAFDLIDLEQVFAADNFTPASVRPQ